MKNKTESNLSRKGVFGSLWRWFKGKIASSCKLSLGISSDISDEKKKQKIDELVKKIQGWDISYYPGDRIKAILKLGDIVQEGGKSTKIMWDDLGGDQKNIILTKLVGFLNRICYGDYTGGPSSNSKREDFMTKIDAQRTDNVLLQKIQIGWYTTDKIFLEKENEVTQSQSNAKKKITNSSFCYDKADVWCCLVNGKSGEYEDGMEGKYFEMIKEYARPVQVRNRHFTSPMDEEIELYQDTKEVLNRDQDVKAGDLTKVLRYHKYKKNDYLETKKISDDLSRISFIMRHGSCYSVEKFVRLGIALLKLLEVDKEIYDKNKELQCFETSKLKDAPLIGLLLTWNGYQYLDKSTGVANTEIKIIKQKKDWVVMQVTWGDVNAYTCDGNILVYVDAQKKLKYINTNYQFGYLLKLAGETGQQLPEDCAEALRYYNEHNKWKQ